MIELEVITPEARILLETVEAVFLPGTLGEFEVLPHHAPIVSSLERGEIRYRLDGKMHSIGIASGFVKFDSDRMMVCVELG